MVIGEEDLDDSATSDAVPETKSEDTVVDNLPKDSEETGGSASEKPPVWVEWRETPDPSNLPNASEANGEVQLDLMDKVVDRGPDASESSDKIANAMPAGDSLQSEDENKTPSYNPADNGDPSTEPITSKGVETAVGAVKEIEN